MEREISLDSETANWQEAEVVEKPFLGMQAVGAGSRGLVFLSPAGLHEGGVRDDARRTMQVTLLRSFRRTVTTEGEHDGLELGRIEHRFALMPFAGRLPANEALAELARLQSGIVTRQSGRRASGFPPLEGNDEPRRSFIEHAGQAIVSAIKPADQGKELIVRVWNPGGETADSTLTFWRKVSRARRLHLNEEPDAAMPPPKVDQRQVHIRVAPHQIVTLGILIDSDSDTAMS